MSRHLRSGFLWSWLLIALVACGVAQPVGREGASPAPKRRPSNVASSAGAFWLEREGREKLEKPEAVLQAMELREGMTVADIGAGTGFFSRRLAKAVGPQGRVYGEDIQPEMLDYL
jgi:predicted methyltransferase